MSLLIKGMEMPEEGYKVIYVHSNGSVYQPTNLENIWHKIASAVPVPPHGRLGDLDELHNHLNEWYLTHEHGFSETEKIYIRAMLSGVKDSPTVIPESKEG